MTRQKTKMYVYTHRTMTPGFDTHLPGGLIKNNNKDKDKDSDIDARV